MVDSDTKPCVWCGTEIRARGGYNTIFVRASRKEARPIGAGDYYALCSDKHNDRRSGELEQRLERMSEEKKERSRILQ